MSIALKTTAFVNQFSCLGDKCEDTCCKGWGMQLDVATKEKYEAEAPELMDAVTSGEAEWIMKRDPATDYCVKFDAGWCGIHASRGSDFLGDACHFFPRITRSLGQTHVMSASLSCPEIVRNVLADDDAFTLQETQTDRIPHSIKDYLPEGITAEDAIAVHAAFISAALDDSVSAARALSRIASVGSSMQMLPVASWAAAVAFYFKNADTRLTAIENVAEDPFNILHALMGLVAASKKTERPRLMQTISDMEKTLAVSLDWNSVGIALSPQSADAANMLNQQYQQQWHGAINPVLRKWLATELSMALFPFSGFGATLSERVTTLGFRFAVTRLALLSYAARHNDLPKEEVVRIIQSLSRFLDHLADPTLLLKICEETGWSRLARMRAIIADI